jgi:hypothetical protein
MEGKAALWVKTVKKQLNFLFFLDIIFNFSDHKLNLKLDILLANLLSTTYFLHTLIA